MIVVKLRDPQKKPDIEKEGEHIGAQLVTLVILKPFAQKGRCPLKLRDKMLRKFRLGKHLFPLGKKFFQAAHFAVDALQRARKGFLFGLPRFSFERQKIGFLKSCGVHIARPVGKIVRFIDQKDGIRLGAIEKTLEIDDGIEQIIVIADNDIAPQGEIQCEFKRTDSVRVGPLLDLLPREEILLLQKTVNGIVHPIVMTFGIRAVIRITARFGAETDLFLCRQRDGLHPQSLFPQKAQRLFRGLARHCLCCQIEDASAQALPHRFYRREQYGDRFSDSGGRLTKQSFFPLDCVVNGHCHFPLSPAVLCERKGCPLGRGGADPLPLHPETRPRLVLMEQIQIEGFQFRKRKLLMELADFFCIHLKIGQPKQDPIQLILRAVNVAVAFCLSPMHFLKILCEHGKREGCRFDFINHHTLICFNDAVGTALKLIGESVKLRCDR